MGENKEENKSVVEIAGLDLSNFAVDREDIKTLIAHLPKETECKPEAVENYHYRLVHIILPGGKPSPR